MHLLRSHDELRAAVLAGLRRGGYVLAAATLGVAYAAIARPHPETAAIALLVACAAVVALLQQTLP